MDSQSNTDPLIGELLNDLFDQTFAEAHGFATLTLAEIGDALERERASMIGDVSVSGMQGSYRKCVECYCLLLLEFESIGDSDWPAYRASELRMPRPASHPSETELNEDTVSGETSLLEPPPLPQNPMPARIISHEEAHPARVAENEVEIFPDPVRPLNETFEAHRDTLGSLCLFPAARDFLRVYSDLEEKRLSSQTPGPIERFSAQALYCALDTELAARLTEPLSTIWNQRKESVEPLLSIERGRLDWAPRIAETLQEWMQSHPQLASSSPASSIISSLRYLQNCESMDVYQPSAIDWGVFLFFFGVEDPSIGLQNRLHVQGLRPNESMEMMLGLCTIHRIRKQSLVPSRPFSGEDLREMERICLRCLELLSKVAFGEDRRVIQVA